MDLNYLKKILRLIESSSVNEIEIEEEGIRIHITKNSSARSAQTQNVRLESQSTGSSPVELPVLPTPEVKSQIKEVEKKYHEIKSPIVGTFYRRPSPDVDPYVDIGSVVQVGTVLCLVEAMKLMNEIESDIAGRIVKILVENGQPVEYNQTLFLIEPLD